MFDPYYKWLGILPKDQPPNHYRLLGIENFESDLDVIEGAADRQMSHVRQYQSGEHAVAAAKVLNELANARLCLLKPATKASYDANLRAALTPPEPESSALPFLIEEPNQKLSLSEKTKNGKGSKPSGMPQPYVIGVAILGILFVIGFVLIPRPKPLKNRQVAANASSTKGTAHSIQSPSVEKSANQSDSVPKGSQELKTVVAKVEDPTKGITDDPGRASQANIPQPEINTAPASMPAETSMSATEPARTIPATPRGPLSAKVGDSVDLLEWAEGVDWAPRGINWNKQIEGKASRTGIKMKNIEAARFPLPVIVDGDYELEVEFTRFDGNGDVAIFFPIGTHTMRLLLSVLQGELSVVDFVDGKDRGVEYRPGTISNNSRHRVVIRVKTNREKSAFNIDFDDTKDYLQWEGATTSLMNMDSSVWRTTLLRHIWLGSHVSNLEFHSARLRLLSGTIQADLITDTDRESDLKNGFVRLVGEKPISAQVGFGEFTVNQFSLRFDAPAQVETGWPYISRDFKVCEDFYPAHAPSSIKCAIPKGAKSFSAVGYNDAGRASKYKVLIDGKLIYESGSTDIAIAKVDIPVKSSSLELATEGVGKNGAATTYWCYPRFYSMASERVKDKMLDGESGPLKFVPLSGVTGYGEVEHNKAIPWVQSIPINFRDAVPCDEFLFAHAPSMVSYRVPKGMRRFTAIGYNVLSHSVQFEVWADAVRVYQSQRMGIVRIDTQIPLDAKVIDLKVIDMNGSASDHSMWCYPRLHRK